MLRSLPRRLLPFLALACALQAGEVDLSGTWKTRFTLSSTGLSLSDLVITLSQSGREVSGTLTMPRFRHPILLKGTCTAGRLRLASPPTRGLTVTLSAQVRDPRKVTGTAVLDYSAPNLGTKQDRTRLEMLR